MVEGLKCSDTDFDKQCEACVLGKMKKIPFPKQTVHRVTELLELVHSDVCGPMNVDSLGGSRYMVTFSDDFSRYTFVYLLRSKDEVLTKFREFVNLVENQTGHKVKTLNLRIKTLRTDNGGEYISKALAAFYAERGIAHEFTNPHCPEQNGVAERMNRTIVESARSMLYHAKLPQHFWAEAVSTAVYLHNRSPTTALSDKPPLSVGSIESLMCQT